MGLNRERVCGLLSAPPGEQTVDMIARDESINEPIIHLPHNVNADYDLVSDDDLLTRTREASSAMESPLNSAIGSQCIT